MKIAKTISFFFILAVLLAAFCFGGKLFRLRFQSGLTNTDRSFILCSINLNALRYFDSRMDGLTELKRISKDNSIDILCMQEVEFYDAIPDSVLFSELREVFPYIHKDGTVAIASKYLIVDFLYNQFYKSYNLFSRYDIAIGTDTVRIENLHLQTSGINIVRNEFTPQQSSKEKYAILKKTMKVNEGARWGQAQAVLEDAEVSPYPVIITGDMNSHPFSRVYKLLSKGRGDSFIEKGAGLGSTYRGLKGVIRTDYILHDKSIKCLGFKRLKDNISDHIGIMSSLEIE